MGKLSREKGKRGEREVANLCKQYGYDCQRTAQNRGKTGEAGDVEGLPGIHIEVKRTEKFSLYEALEQAKRDATAKGEGDMPVVFHRKNDHEWVVVMAAGDFFTIYREWEAAVAVKGLIYAVEKLKDDQPNK